MARQRWWGVRPLVRALRDRRLAREALRELRGIRVALDGIAAVLTAVYAQQYPQPGAADPANPAVSVTFVDSLVQEEFMDIELQLTKAIGQPPTEYQVLEEYQRRHPEQDLSAGLEEAAARDTRLAAGGRGVQ